MLTPRFLRTAATPLALALASPVYAHSTTSAPTDAVALAKALGWSNDLTLLLTDDTIRALQNARSETAAAAVERAVAEATEAHSQATGSTSIAHVEVASMALAAYRPSEATIALIAGYQCGSADCLDEATDILNGSMLVESTLASEGASDLDEWVWSQESEYSAVEFIAWIAVSESAFWRWLDQGGLDPTQFTKDQILAFANNHGVSPTLLDITATEAACEDEGGSAFGECGVPGLTPDAGPTPVDPLPTGFTGLDITGFGADAFATTPVWMLPGSCMAIDPNHLFDAASWPLGVTPQDWLKSAEAKLIHQQEVMKTADQQFQDAMGAALGTGFTSGNVVSFVAGAVVATAIALDYQIELKALHTAQTEYRLALEAVQEWEKLLKEAEAARRAGTDEASTRTATESPDPFGDTADVCADTIESSLLGCLIEAMPEAGAVSCDIAPISQCAPGDFSCLDSLCDCSGESDDQGDEESGDCPVECDPATMTDPDAGVDCSSCYDDPDDPQDYANLVAICSSGAALPPGLLDLCGAVDPLP